MQPLATGLELIALVILTCAVTIGALTAYVRIAEKNTPFDIGLLHGRAGVVATVLLLVSIMISNETSQMIKPTLGLLVLTIIGGITLYFVIRRKGILPTSIIFIHGVLAITAVHTLMFGL